MKKTICLTLALPAMFALAAPAQAQVAGDIVPNSFICVFKKDAVSRGAVQSEAARVAKTEGGQVSRTYSAGLRGFAVNMSPAAVNRMKVKNSSIAYCEQDRIVSLAPVIANGKVSGGGSTQPAQTTPWGVARVNGGGAGTFGTAWVIDTGIDLTHPDLNVDVARSRSFAGQGTTPADQHGHGTHVSGIIAARNNTIGVIGVAPGARLVSVRVLDRRGSGSISAVIAGVDYVAQAGVPGDVANMSLGGGISQALDDSIVAASAGGVKFTLAAGNDADNANNHSPARANGPNIYTVSAITVGDLWASFSNYGNPPIDFAEPGMSITSTWLAGSYNTISGTSMAAPHLAGILLAGTPVAGGTVKNDPAAPADTVGTR